MSHDEKEIRDLVEAWLAASRDGEIDTLLGLMTDDVVFMVPGAKPFGKEIFRQLSQGMEKVQLDGSCEIAELQVLGDWAFLRNHIEMSATPPDGPAIRRSGFTLTILRKEPDGRWRIARDANLLTVDR